MPARTGRTGEVERHVRAALREDRFRDDRTTALLLPGPIPARARVLAQASGILAGIDAARACARVGRVRVRSARADGARLRRGTPVMVLEGDARRILAIERTLLNYLMHLSGIASATARAVRRVRAPGRRAPEIWATRKTLPGLRDLEKSAVVAGGGRPHRRDLSDAVLVKNNHLAVIGGPRALARTRAARRGAGTEVEVRTPAAALAAVGAGVRRLLIDNASPAKARAIVRALERSGRRPDLWVELSGGLTPENVRRYRSVGADALSLGSVTHSAPALPFHLVLRPARRP